MGVIGRVLLFAAAAAAAVAAGTLLPLPAWARPLPELAVALLFRAQIWRAMRPVREMAAAASERALYKWNNQRRAALLIPFVAAFVGWLTNWVAVQMIFYPIDFWGLPLKRWVLGSLYDCDILQPLGLIGWQGIVPAKAAQMSFNMVEMVTTQLINVQEVFAKLDPAAIARLLQEEMPKLALEAGGGGLLPDAYVSLAAGRVPALPGFLKAAATSLQDDYVAGLVEAMQRNVHAVIDLKELVVKEMWSDKNIIVSFFQTCGKAELRFLVDSGIYFGFLLGIIQMAIWLVYDSPWTLTVGGVVVGLLTNWLALKCIFEPLHPVTWGPFVFQGIFLKRQYEVSCEFARFLANEVLVSSKIWGNMLFGSRAGDFQELAREHTQQFVERLQPEVAAQGGQQFINEVADAAVRELPGHIAPLHGYIDSTLGLQQLMESKLKLMTPEQFERVLHPIFEEDELTLILAGAVLGGIAGYGQQLLDERDRASKAATSAATVGAGGAGASLALPSPPAATAAPAGAEAQPAPSAPTGGSGEAQKASPDALDARYGTREQWQAADTAAGSAEAEVEPDVVEEIAESTPPRGGEGSPPAAAAPPGRVDAETARGAADSALAEAGSAELPGGPTTNATEVDTALSQPVDEASTPSPVSATSSSSSSSSSSSDGAAQQTELAAERTVSDSAAPTPAQRRQAGYFVFVVLPIVLTAFGSFR